MLDKIITDLAEPPKHDVVRIYLRQLGAQHVDFQTRGFNLRFWDIFTEAMTDCALEWEGGVRYVPVTKDYTSLDSFQHWSPNTCIKLAVQVCIIPFISIAHQSCFYCRCGETMKAYRLFVFYVVGEMREGFLAEMNRRRMIQKRSSLTAGTMADSMVVSPSPSMVPVQHSVDSPMVQRVRHVSNSLAHHQSMYERRDHSPNQLADL
jgi:hypothetical protein